MPGTYITALALVAVSLPIGAAVLALSGVRQWSWISPAVGLALATVVAWWAVRLPGDGVTAAASLGILAAASGLWVRGRVEGLDTALREGLPVALTALAAVSIPFIVEGHFGILGTGFNVDMSQHLFAADWLANPVAAAPDLVKQGYPMGPHALAVAGARISGGELATAFSGVTIAVPVLGALTALAAVQRLSHGRALVVALLAALPYLVASYLAQGSFKELFEAVFLLGFVLWLAELKAGRLGSSRLAALPGAVLGAGALYAYSGPGLAWLLGTLGIWGVAELLRRPRAERRAVLSRVLPAAGIAVVALLVLAAPEIGRIAEFGGNAGTVANASDNEPAASRTGTADGGTASGAAPAAAGAGAANAHASKPTNAGAGADSKGLDLFNNDLGNLFGDISPLEAFGVWPSGDFRVEPGDGAIPAPVFYLGALLGALALAIGLAGSLGRGDRALPAALAAAAAIWLAARIGSTPYTAAKALQMVSVPAMLLAAREMLDPSFVTPRLPGARWRPTMRALLTAAFVGAAALSSALALANAPVGPERYSPGIAKLREQLTAKPVLVLAPEGQLADRHGAAFYGWELRGAHPICVAAFPAESGAFSGPTPAGIRYVITIGGKQLAPFDDLRLSSHKRRIAVWEAEGFNGERAPAVEIDPHEPTSCALGLP